MSWYGLEVQENPLPHAEVKEPNYKEKQKRTPTNKRGSSGPGTHLRKANQRYGQGAQTVR
eukprot:960671-Amphidinium_carterae.1